MRYNQHQSFNRMKVSNSHRSHQKLVFKKCCLMSSSLNKAYIEHDIRLRTHQALFVENSFHSQITTRFRTLLIWQDLMYEVITDKKEGKFVLSQWNGPNRDENGEWRRLHNEEFHSLYRIPNIVRVIKSTRLRWIGHVVRMEEDWTNLKMLTGESTVRRPLVRPRSRWEEILRNRCQIWGIGFIQLRIRITETLLWMWHWTFGFHNPWITVSLV